MVCYKYEHDSSVIVTLDCWILAAKQEVIITNIVGLCWSQALVILDYDGMRELISIIGMLVQSLAVAEGRQTGVVNMKVSVNEDNLGALVLAETLPPQFTPRSSKYYATKTIWFREEINKRVIKLLKIDTTEQRIFSPRVCVSPRLSTFGPKSLVGNYFEIFRFVLVSVQLL